MISNKSRPYYNTPKNSFSNAIGRSSSTLINDSSINSSSLSATSVSTEVQNTNNLLISKLDEMKYILSMCNSNVACIQKEDEKHKIQELDKSVISPFKSTLDKYTHDYSYYHSNSKELFYKEYFTDLSTLPYDFKVINFFMNLISTDNQSIISVELLNFEDFKNCLVEKIIRLKKKYCIIYMIDKKFIKDHKTLLNHYLCLVDVEKLTIHVINPLNDYSINSDIINLKLLIDLSYKTADTQIKICHNPITTKPHNSGCHTFLNIYSLVSDMNQYMNNVNNKANDQFTFFVPDNANIRNQCYTVLMYLLENCSNKSGMEHYQYYKEHLSNLLK